MARQPLKKSVRFEVFKRDSFTCQYCGQKSPDVVLEVDHITPVADGGDNDILNLVTACKACNAGKSDRLLASTDALDKRRAQLEDLEDRRQQLEMLHQWHMSLIDLDDQAVDMAQALWFESLGEPGFKWTAVARDEIRKLVKRNGFDSVCAAIREAADAALKSSRIHEDFVGVGNEWFWKIGRVLSVRKLEQKDPVISKLFYIRGILRNRCDYLNEVACICLLKEAKQAGMCLDWLEQFAKQVRSWSQFRDTVSQTLRDWETEDEEATDGTHTQS